MLAFLTRFYATPASATSLWGSSFSLTHKIRGFWWLAGIQQVKEADFGGPARVLESGTYRHNCGPHRPFLLWMVIINMKNSGSSSRACFSSGTDLSRPNDASAVLSPIMVSSEPVGSGISYTPTYCHCSGTLHQTHNISRV